MNEDDDLLWFSLRQAVKNFTLKRGNRRFVRGHDARRAAIAGGTDHRRIRTSGNRPISLIPPSFISPRAPFESVSMRISIDPKLIVRERSDP
jgi:hypothetical protein